MVRKILALLENSIGPNLLLPTRLGALGYAVTVLSSAHEATRRLGSETFDWLILDEAVWRTQGRRLLRSLARQRAPVRIVWLGVPPAGTRVPIQAVFPKPLDYEGIARFFSAPPREPPSWSDLPSGEPERSLSRGGGEGLCSSTGRENFRGLTNAATEPAPGAQEGEGGDTR